MNPTTVRPYVLDITYSVLADAIALEREKAATRRKPNLSAHLSRISAVLLTLIGDAYKRQAYRGGAKPKNPGRVNPFHQSVSTGSWISDPIWGKLYTYM